MRRSKRNRESARIKTTWHRVVVWGKQAEIAGRYLRRGSQVFIEGKIDNRDWTDKEGKRHTSFEIVCENFRMLGEATGNGNGRPEKSIKGELSDDGVWPAKSQEQADEEIPF